MEVIVLKKEQHFETIMRAVQVLREGSIIAVPTDTVYGLAGDATSNHAVERLFRIKGREEGMPVPIFVDTMERAKQIAFIEEKKLEETLRRYWLASPSQGGPGAFTAILYAREVVAPAARGRGGLTIGVRMPNHRFLRDLIRAFGKPITGTSANQSGMKPATSAREVTDVFGATPLQPDMIIDGGICNRAPSTVVDFIVTPPKIIRP